MNTETGEIRRLGPGDKPGPNEIEISEMQAAIASQVAKMPPTELKHETANYSRAERRAAARKMNGGRSAFAASLK